MKKTIKLTESQIHMIVRESVSKILSEEYASNYEDLIKNEMHRLYDLEGKVPHWVKPELHSIVVKMEGILLEIKRNNDISSI